MKKVKEWWDFAYPFMLPAIGLVLFIIAVGTLMILVTQPKF